MDWFSLVEEIMDIFDDTILNKEQRRRFIETTIASYLFNLEPEHLPGIKAAIKVSRWP
jgi:hypothetical protein